MTELTLQALIKRARDEGWDVSMTSNVHLDRADWPAGTGAVLVENFNEDGLPGLYAAGTPMEGQVTIAGDKINERPHADTVEGVLEWARYTWDSPDDPLPVIFGPPGPFPPAEIVGFPREGGDFDKLYSITESMIMDDIKDFVRDQMVQWGWAEQTVEGDYELTEAGRAQLEENG